MDDLKIYEEVIRLKQARIPAALATVVQSEGSAPRKAGAKMLVRADGTLMGTVGGGAVEAGTLEAARRIAKGGRPRTLDFSLTAEQGLVCGGTVKVYIEPLWSAPRLIAVGAGHIGQALARLGRLAGFEVTLVDPYPEPSGYSNQGFAAADVVCPLCEVFERLNVDEDGSIVIAARGHNDDFALVKGALATPARFVGLLGSRRKKTALREYLLAAGLGIGDFERVVSPVGLDIGAETPEEIAVSILAQLIQIRRNDDREDRRHSALCREIPAHGEPQASAAAGG